MPDLLIDGLAHLIAQLAAQLGVRIDRLLARMDRMDQRQQLAFISEAFPELIDPFLAATAEATAGVYDELPGPAGFFATGGDLLPRGLLAAKGRIGLLERSPRDALAGIGDQLLHRQSRETMVANAVRENVRWGRHASASACGWCRMLATRGAVYGSAELAESSHPSCHCMAVPARNGRYEEAPYVEQWREDYAQARRDGATTPGQIANAMDKAEGGRRAPAPQSGGGGGKPPTKPPTPTAPGGGDFPEDAAGWKRVFDHAWERHAPNAHESGQMGTKFPAGSTREAIEALVREILSRERIQAESGPVDPAVKARLDAGEIALAEQRKDFVNLYAQVGDVRYEIRLAGKDSTVHPIDGTGVVRHVEKGGEVKEVQVPLGKRPVAGWNRSK